MNTYTDISKALKEHYINGLEIVVSSTIQHLKTGMIEFQIGSPFHSQFLSMVSAQFIRDVYERLGITNDKLTISIDNERLHFLFDPHEIIDDNNALPVASDENRMHLSQMIKSDNVDVDDVINIYRFVTRFDWRKYPEFVSTVLRKMNDLETQIQTKTPAEDFTKWRSNRSLWASWVTLHKKD